MIGAARSAMVGVPNRVTIARTNGPIAAIASMGSRIQFRRSAINKPTQGAGLGPPVVCHADSHQELLAPEMASGFATANDVSAERSLGPHERHRIADHQAAKPMIVLYPNR